MKMPPLIGAFTIVLALVFAAGWRREHNLLKKLALENSKLSLELKNLEQSEASVGAGVYEPSQFSEEASNAQSKRNDSIEQPPGPRELDQSGTNRLAESTLTVTPAITSENVHEHQVVDVVPKNTQSLSYTESQLEIYRCSNQMLEINIATGRWAADHNGIMPQNLIDLRGYLAPMILVCPGTRPTVLTARWDIFSAKEITYQTYSGARGSQWDFEIGGLDSPQTKHWLSCPLHKITTLNRVMPGIGIPSDQVFKGDMRK
jgi:hypothetical protein